MPDTAEIRKDVEDTLKSYTQKKEEILRRREVIRDLKNNLMNNQEFRVQKDKVLMRYILKTFSHDNSLGVGISVGHISDKTYSCIEALENKIEEINWGPRMQAKEEELHDLENRLNRLEQYVSALEARQREIIERHYFNGENFLDIAEAMHYCEKTIQRSHKSAVDNLIKMYEDYYRTIEEMLNEAAEGIGLDANGIEQSGGQGHE